MDADPLATLTTCPHCGSLDADPGRVAACQRATTLEAVKAAEAEARARAEVPAMLALLRVLPVTLSEQMAWDQDRLALLARVDRA